MGDGIHLQKENPEPEMYALDAFFSEKPEVRPLFDALARRILAAHPDTFIKVQKSQISFCGEKPFCWAWLPIRDHIKGRPEHYLVVSFGLDREIVHPRLVDTANPYPGRWTHHVIVGRLEEIDAELMRWIDLAYHWKNGSVAR